jgi:ureidoglycolate hydrolase
MAAPILDDDPGLQAVAKPFHGQAFIPQFSVEAFVSAVLPRLARFDQNRFQFFIDSPLQQLRADELRAVVHAQWGLVSHRQQVHPLDYDILRGIFPMTERIVELAHSLPQPCRILGGDLSCC